MKINQAEFPPTIYLGEYRLRRCEPGMVGNFASACILEKCGGPT